MSPPCTPAAVPNRFILQKSDREILEGARALGMGDLIRKPNKLKEELKRLYNTFGPSFIVGWDTNKKD
jgi:hypothetical protein